MSQKSFSILFYFGMKYSNSKFLKNDKIVPNIINSLF